MTLRGLAVSSAPCSNHGSHNSVQGPQGTSQPPAGEVGRVKATLAMMYTCGKCETRSMKTFSHQAYKHGVVLVGYALQHASLLVPIEMLCLHVLHLLGLAQMFSAIGKERKGKSSGQWKHSPPSMKDQELSSHLSARNSMKPQGTLPIVPELAPHCRQPWLASNNPARSLTASASLGRGAWLELELIVSSPALVRCN
eukprot:1160917-Pelagomonas_calceolata.AAC.3